MATLTRGLAPRKAAASPASSRACVAGRFRPAAPLHGPCRRRRSTARRPPPPALVGVGEAASTAATTSAAAATTALTASLSPSTRDAAISVGFVAAAVALAMVSAGVAYLSYLSWRDGRAEEAAAEAEAAAEQRR